MPDPLPLKVVRLTPAGRGAVATLLVEGPGAEAVVRSRFRTCGGRPLREGPTRRLAFGHFHFGALHDEEVVLRRRSEESVEVHCHGGRAAVAAVERALVELGCGPVSWQDWTAGHHPDPISAAAQVALAEARAERTAAVLLDQLNGALRGAVEAVRRALRQGDAAAAAERLGALLDRADLGRHLVEPWRVVAAGPPNAGKSSLINALVGYQRAIVHPAPGTTRDVVSAATAVEGWPVELSDTAGLRPAEPGLERAGIALARKKLDAADLALLVFDATEPWSPAADRLVESRPDALVIHNKLDLCASFESPRPPGLRTSATTGEGIQILIGTIAGRLVPEVPAEGAAVPFTVAQIDRLRSAAGALSRNDTAAAATILSSI